MTYVGWLKMDLDAAFCVTLIMELIKLISNVKCELWALDAFG